MEDSTSALMLDRQAGEVEEVESTRGLFTSTDRTSDDELCMREGKRTGKKNQLKDEKPEAGCGDCQLGRTRSTVTSSNRVSKVWWCW